MKRCFKVRWVGLVILIFGFSLSNIVKAESEIEEILSKIKNKTMKMDSYKVDYVLDINKQNKMIRSNGHMKFKSPDKFFMIVQLSQQETAKQIFVSNGNLIWQYIPSMKVATKLNLNKIKDKEVKKRFKKGDIRDPFSNMKKDSLKLVEKINRDGRLIYLIQAEPKDNVKKDMLVDISKVEIWILEESGLPEKVVWYDKNGGIIIKQEFENIEINVDIKDSQFDFKPSSDIKVINVNRENR